MTIQEWKGYLSWRFEHHPDSIIWLDDYSHEEPSVAEIKQLQEWCRDRGWDWYTGDHGGRASITKIYSRKSLSDQILD